MGMYTLQNPSEVFGIKILQKTWSCPYVFGQGAVCGGRSGHLVANAVAMVQSMQLLKRESGRGQGCSQVSSSMVHWLLHMLYMSNRGHGSGEHFGMSSLKQENQTSGCRRHLCEWKNKTNSMPKCCTAGCECWWPPGACCRCVGQADWCSLIPDVLNFPSWPLPLFSKYSLRAGLMWVGLTSAGIRY